MSGVVSGVVSDAVTWCVPTVLSRGLAIAVGTPAKGFAIAHSTGPRNRTTS